MLLYGYGDFFLGGQSDHSGEVFPLARSFVLISMSSVKISVDLRLLLDHFTIDVYSASQQV